VCSRGVEQVLRLRRHGHSRSCFPGVGKKISSLPVEFLLPRSAAWSKSGAAVEAPMQIRYEIERLLVRISANSR